VKIVVDTNIVFSALLNGDSSIHDILFNSHGVFNFYSPELLISELEKYSDKLIILSKLSPAEISEAKFRLFTTIHVVSEELIPEINWHEAYLLSKDVDEDDTPFIALAMQLNCPLWTGDKKTCERNGCKRI